LIKFVDMRDPHAGEQGFIELQKLRKGGADDLTFHNITHPMCPNWLQEIVRSDPDYCSERPKISTRALLRSSRKAADLVAQAEGLERHASISPTSRRRSVKVVHPAAAAAATTGRPTAAADRLRRRA
jgi:hypothetical protein